MHGDDFLLKDTHGLELEIERHCVGLKLDSTDEYQVHQFIGEMLQNMERLKEAAGKGDRTARAKVELFGMVVLMHRANVKAFGPEYIANINVLAKQESAWVAFAKAMWSELESRNLDNE
ncbi:hypothetical protein [Sideroxydans sp. CL21]|uniref:hypothetical protein n=1 Tax=Sideroxydans sp. CL21 TaxID=2600596 RepID=UPI0024BD3D40|nr:hypothetical protein [Sideroxydans sp. CL21]